MSRITTLILFFLFIQIHLAWCDETQEIITSYPEGADVYWGENKNLLVRTEFKTPHTRMIETDAWESWCYQLKKEGYSDSTIICRYEESGERTVNFNPALIARPYPRHIWEIGPILSHLEYEEPNFMNEKGTLYGVEGSYNLRDEVSIKLEGRYCQGQVDYESPISGTMQNIDDYMYELRGLIGYEFITSKGNTITPHIGYGYRYLNDDSSGMRSSTGDYGYERESNYYYVPINLETVIKMSDKWNFAIILEYDFFLEGKQISHFSDVYPGYNNIQNNQNSGYGYRGSLKFKRINSSFDFVIEPFIRYWKIDESEWDIITLYGSPIGYGYEPENESTETGIIFKVAF